MAQESNEEIKCIGCGAGLQSQDKKKEGYVPSSALTNHENISNLYCQRCFRLRHYNDLMEVEWDEESFTQVLNEISENEALTVHIVDLFDIEGSLISGIERFSRDQPLIIVGNKTDLLPQSSKLNRIRQWFAEHLSYQGIRPDEVLVMSAHSEKDIQELLKVIEKYRKNKNVYFVGTTNVGKSTFVNGIIEFGTEEKEVITTSYFPGTTLGKIEIPLEDGGHLIDTPGIIQKHQTSYYLETKEMSKIVPKKRIKPKSFQLEEAQTLFIGGLGRLDIVDTEEKRQSFVVYTSNEIYIHRTKTDNAERIYETGVGDYLTPPLEQDHKIPELVSHTFKIKEKTDVTIAGLGWVTCEPGTTVAVWAPRGILVTARRAMI